MHPIEHMVYFSGVMLFWILPSNPFHSVYLLMYLVLGDIVGHLGFDRLVLGNRLSINTNHYMHYLHHKYVRVNYGTGVLPFDRLLGTFHDGSDEAMNCLKRRARAVAMESRHSVR
jgi:sterol desaturase/sphingolipid hydroxylase (fatty acid hydroxylase superfamily)